jgi:glycosyltransferase involved in cell wall biosynthesis
VPRINILVHVHAVGIQMNAAILANALRRAGFDVTLTRFHPDVHHRTARALTKARRILLKRPVYDVNVFIETPLSTWFPMARLNGLIPNQEWMRDEYAEALPGIDRMLCKTRHAESVFRENGYPTQYLGFSSVDCNDDAVPTEYRSFVHIAGGSRQKGTQAICRVWGKHPEWPPVHLYTHLDNLEVPDAPNIVMHRGFMKEEHLRRVQNACGMHLCPSEAEAWGHYLVEAMSCGAVVVTTDGPPMNELVSSECGILVPYGRSAPMRLGTSFSVDEGALERAIGGLLQMSIEERVQIGRRAREWFLMNRAEFLQRVGVVFTELCRQ